MATKLCEVCEYDSRSVTITVDEYKNLVERACKHDMLIDALLDAADLDYSHKKLSVFSDILDMTLRTLEHDSYTARLHELQAEKEEE